nr:uncharacterized protein LOC105730368 [Aotus nancymaae]
MTINDFIANDWSRGLQIQLRAPRGTLRTQRTQRLPSNKFPADPGHPLKEGARGCHKGRLITPSKDSQQTSSVWALPTTKPGGGGARVPEQGKDNQLFPFLGSEAKKPEGLAVVLALGLLTL